MKKFKNFLIKNWINILLITFVICTAFISVLYARKFTALAKDTNEIRSIWQLAITAIAASVGIGTIINSTRSASTAAESMKVTKDRELREQSSHPVVLSLIAKFPYRAPMYEKNVSYNFPSEPKLGSTKDKVEMKARSDQQFINTIKDSLIKQETYNHNLELVNTGKGSCVNLEYEFSFLNLNDFVGYSVEYENLTDIENYTRVPSYSLSVDEYKRIFEITTIDNHIAKFVEKINMIPEFKSSSVKNILRFDKNTTIRNYNYLESGKRIELPIPNEFILLSRHYALIEILKRKIKNNEMFSTLLPSIDPLVRSNHIMPIGRVTISFYDESLIRTGAYSPDKKIKINYSVSIKTSALNIYDDDFEMYLEANLTHPENTL